MLQKNLWQAGENSGFEKEFPSYCIWQTIRTSHYRMNDAIIWCVSRSVSGHIQGAFVPNSDPGYRRIWLKNAISYIAFVSPECEHVKSLTCVRLFATPWTVTYQAPQATVHGVFQARVLEWVAISFSNAWKWKGKVKSLSRARLLTTPWTAAYQVPPSMGFSKQEYWSGLPLPSPKIIIKN